MSKPPAGVSPNLVFPDQSDSFAHGFMCGVIWHQMGMPHTNRVDATLKPELREAVLAMAMATGWIEEISVVEGGWIKVVLYRHHPDHAPQ